MKPQRLVQFDPARAQILAQHDELQRLLRMSAALVGAAARGDQPCREEIPHTLDTLAGKLQAHLDFEEGNLFPLLERRAVAVPRLVHQREEHARQRQELTRLEGVAWNCNDLGALAAAFDAFGADLRADMAEEERWLAAQKSSSPTEVKASLGEQGDDGPQGESHADDL